MKFVFAALPLLILVSGCACEKKVVQEVGACDLEGMCRVRYTDGTLGFQQYPVAGQEMAECGG